jgi:hypothetical protein
MHAAAEPFLLSSLQTKAIIIFQFFMIKTCSKREKQTGRNRREVLHRDRPIKIAVIHIEILLMTKKSSYTNEQKCKIYINYNSI